MDLKARSCEQCIRGVGHCGMCGDELERFVPMSRQSEDEDRMDVVGSNGNEGLHYGAEVDRNVAAVSLACALSEMKFNSSGSKYLRKVDCLVDGKMDVYAVLDSFGVVCPARQHAIKKLLCSGIRGKGSMLQDLSEARDAIDRAIQMHIAKGL